MPPLLVAGRRAARPSSLQAASADSNASFSPSAVPSRLGGPRRGRRPVSSPGFGHRMGRRILHPDNVVWWIFIIVAVSLWVTMATVTNLRGQDPEGSTHQQGWEDVQGGLSVQVRYSSDKEQSSQKRQHHARAVSLRGASAATGGDEEEQIPDLHNSMRTEEAAAAQEPKAAAAAAPSPSSDAPKEDIRISFRNRGDFFSSEETIGDLPSREEELHSEEEHPGHGAGEDEDEDEATAALYPGQFILGKERRIPANAKQRPPDGPHLHGKTIRWDARSDLVEAVRMEARPVLPLLSSAADLNASSEGASGGGREGCPGAAQPLRLVPEFSTYIFKHYADAPTGKSLRYVHMGVVSQLPSGSLLAAFQGSQFTEGAEDQRIFLSHSRDFGVGRRWSQPFQVPVRVRGAQWGPVLHVHPKSGSVWMFYTESSNPKCLRAASEKFPPRYAPGGDVLVTKTRDGKNWAPPHRILSMAADGGTPKVIANSVHVTRSGAWILPFWRESKYFNMQTPCKTTMGDGHGVLISRDDGKTWVTRGNITMDRTHLYEGTVSELGDGSLMMLFRTELGAAAASRSKDDGETWSSPMLLTVDNPDSKPSMINVWPNGEQVLAYNDHTKGNIPCKNCRSKLTISRLVNSTGAWDHLAQFGPSPSDYFKVHYPSLTQHGCRLLAIYSSMYACCSPFNEFSCDQCAAPMAEVGLVFESFKIWEGGKTPEQQMAAYRMKTQKTAAPEEEPHQWGNSWWSSDSGGRETFERVLEAKRAEQKALHPEQKDTGPREGVRAAGALEFPSSAASSGGWAGATVA